MTNNAVRVIISAATQDEMNEMYSTFLGDQGGRITVASMAPTLPILEDVLQRVRAEVAVVDLELMAGRPEGDITTFLETRLGEAVGIVLIPLGMEALRGTLTSLSRVRQVLTKPVAYAELIHVVHQVGVSDRAATYAVAPAQSYVRVTDSPAQAVAGQRVFAVCASKGGTGKTTVALHFAYQRERFCILRHPPFFDQGQGQGQFGRQVARLLGEAQVRCDDDRVF